MKLKRVRIDGFRSVKEPMELHIDPRLTILIGANDHGKTNLLEAIRSLNDDRSFVTDDENWDLAGQDRLVVEHDFILDPDELEWITSQVESARNAAQEAKATESPSSSANESSEGETSVEKLEQNRVEVATESPASLKIPDIVTFRRRGIGGELEVVLSGELAELEGVKDYLVKARPRVEVFARAEQLMDVVTLPELEDSTQEFMQGIFRYAGIWERRKTLFRQDPGTARQLEKASQAFTERIRAEWKQGENLTFEFQHAGQDGNRIALMIRDPSVTERFVRPSERSEGFSAFFMLNMRLLARTESNRPHNYLFLFDEPGTGLHPSGQVNLQRVFERLARDNQIIYATHSLFMINHNRPERNRVVSKGIGGTKVDQKPYLRNWRAVRDSLGLILAGNFFIADTTLLLEGESDALYIGALLSAFDRAEIIDIDLNLFSVKWAGNSSDFEPMARLMLEEGRRVIAVVDGDRAGNELKKRIEKLNQAVERKAIVAHGPVEVLQLGKNESIEDIVPSRERYFDVVLAAAKELVAAGYRRPADEAAFTDERLLTELKAPKGNYTLGKHVSNITRQWFEDKDPISKLTIAQHYCAWLEEAKLKDLGVSECPPFLTKLIEGLKLESKLSEETLLAKRA